MDEQPQDTAPSIERMMIRSALDQAQGNKALAARLLGISQAELQERMRPDRRVTQRQAELGDAFGRASARRRTGKRDQAHEQLGTATTMYREMDMRFWLEQAEVELRRP
jgi:hypothetical protein